ncbi:hypothetical protein C0J52_04113 [Blattella germanica]|nr:hypothetical protein C0J52_04113 [Blattella germanica]
MNTIMSQTLWCMVMFVLIGNVVLSNSKISNKRQCGDPECSHPVSLAKTLIRYFSDDQHVLSFGQNIDVRIYSKSAGSNPNLWGAEINGKRGYIPKGLVREYRILKKTLPYEVDTGETENDISINNANVTDTASTILSSIESNRNIVTNEKAGLNTDDSKLNLNGESEGDNTLSKTPALGKTSFFADVTFPSFAGSGVSAETIDSDNGPNPKDIPQPFEVVDGTTLYYDTDGSQTKSDAILPTVTAPSQPSVVHDHGASGDSISPSSEEVANTVVASTNKESKDGGDVEVEETSGDVYQYITSWMSGDKSETEGIEPEKANEDGSGLKEENLNEKESLDDVKASEKNDSENSKLGEEIKEETLIKRTKRDIGSDQANPVENSEEETLKSGEKRSVDDRSEQVTNSEDKENVVDREEEDAKILIEKEDLSNLHSTSTGSVNQNLELDKINVQESEVSLTDQHSTPLPATLDPSPSTEETATHGNALEEKNISDFTENVETKPTERNSEEQVILPGSLLNENEERGPSKENILQVVGLPSNNINAKSEFLQSEEYENAENSLKMVGSEFKNDLLQAGVINDPSNDEKISLPIKEITEPPVEDPVTEISNSGLESDTTTVSPEISKELPSISSQDSSQLTTSTPSEIHTEAPFTDSTDEPNVEKEEKVIPAEVSTEVPPKVYVDTNEEPVKESGEPEVYIKSSEEPVNESDGYIPSFFVDLLNIFYSSDNVPEEESELKVPSENILKVDKTNEKRDAAWTSFWGGANRDAADQEKKSDSDLSSGIGSECSQVVGQRPTFPPIMEGDADELEENDKVSEEGVLSMDLYRSSTDIFVCLIITGVTVLVFSLGYFYLEKKRRDGSLVAKINQLEKALLVSSKECLILKDDLDITKQKLLSIENSSVDSGETVASLNLELEEYKVAKTELEDQVSSLEKELEAATEAGLELNRMLSDFLSSQNSSDTVMKSVEHLQKQLDSQQATITSLTESLSVKTTENESLQADLNTALEKINSLEEDVHKVNENLTDVLSEKLRMEEQLLEKNETLCKEIEEVKNTKNSEITELQKEISSLKEKISEINNILVTKESEVSVLQDCLKQLKAVDDGEGDDKLQSLLDVGQTKAELKIMEIERDSLSERLQGEEDARKLLEDHLRIINEEIKRLRESYSESEKEKVEAQKRLEVLTEYFKEKETQLQRELGLQEAMCLQKEGDATSTYERIKSLEEEIENYKSQNETLKKEILDQERGLKCQIASLEKKAHENWVAARQAERRLEENKQEASQLRNRLIIVEKNATNASKNSETPKINDSKY